MIAIIVDHPNRDLPSIVNISELLIKNNITNSVVLTPFYFIDNFFLSSLFKKQIKYVVYNYLRINIFKYLRYSSNAGKINIIYDTEGAPGSDGLGLYKSFKVSKDYFNYIDHYIFWGTKQIQDIKKNFKLPFKTSTAGYIRFHQKNLLSTKKKKILINTNFAFGDPKFNSKVKEIKEYNKLGFSDLSHAKKISDETYLRKINFINTIEQLIKNNFYEDFIIRPHPFENKESYNFLLKKYKNVSYDKSLTSIKSLSNSKLLIHIDCTTSIEAFYLGIPILTLSWLKNNQISTYKLTDGIGYQAKNLEDASSFITNNKYNSFKEKNYNKIKKNLERFFGSFKNNSLENFVKIVNKIIKKKINKKAKLFYFLSLKSYIKVFLSFIFPNLIYEFLLKIIRGNALINLRKLKTIHQINIERELNKNVMVYKLSNKSFILKKLYYEKSYQK